MTARAVAIYAICKAADWLHAQGVELPPDIAAALKALSRRRDQREPDRHKKELLDLKIAALVERVFKRQLSATIAHANTLQQVEAKATPTIPKIEWDEEDTSELVSLLQDATRNGVNLLDTMANLEFDYRLTNKEAARAAEKYAYQLIKEIDKTTVEALRSAISQFVETPGMSIGDLVDLLPFDPDRAELIAITEVTRAYAQGQMDAADALKEQYPDVEIVKQWFTNNDDRVCDICGPLDGVELPIDESFGEDIFGEAMQAPPAHPGCRCWQSTGTNING